MNGLPTCHRNAAAWILLGILLTLVARVALLRPLTILLDLAHRPFQLISILGTPITGGASASLVYLLLRCWLLPPADRTVRSVFGLPAITLLGCALIAWAYIPIAEWLATPLIPTATTVAIDLGTMTAVLPAIVFLLIVAGGIFVGTGLWATERLGSALFRLPVRPWLLLAHTVGIACIAGAGSVFTSLARRIDAGITDPAAMVGLVSLIVQTLSAIPHLTFTWLAWRPAATSATTKQPIALV